MSTLRFKEDFISDAITEEISAISLNADGEVRDCAEFNNVNNVQEAVQ